MLANAPLVSIVIPAFNHADYLNESIDSVLAQDYPRVELVVLDDGSTDPTPELLRGYGDRFRWESQKNIGQSATLTKGWAMTRGEILGYLSADDRLEPSSVRESVAAMAEHPEAIATYCDFNLIDLNSRVVRRVSTPDFDYRSMLVDVICSPGPGAFFRRTAYERAGPWDATLRQMPDYDFWLRLGLFGPFVRIPKVLAGFRVHDASQTFGNVSPERAAEPVRIVARLFERPGLSAEITPLRDKAMANAELVSAQLHFRAGRLVNGLQGVRRAATIYPPAVRSLRALHLLANAALNRIGHRVLWSLRSLLPERRT